MNLHEKILSIMQEVRRLQKDDQVEFGNTKYKALSEEKVTEIMRQQLVEKRIVVFPIEQNCSRTGQITHVDVKYRMVNVDDPTDFIEIVSSGDGADSQDKGAGKAMTYAYKYMWLRTFALPTGEDPDKISSAQLDDEEKKRREEDKAKRKAAERLAARAQCQKTVKLYCQQNHVNEAEAWQIIADTIGKSSKEFTKEDWEQGHQIAEAWNK